MNKIIDSFLWFNEVEILKMRLYEVGDIVDHFLLVEADHTHSGKPRDLLFPTLVNDPIVKKYVNKIEHCVVDDYPCKGYMPGNTDRSWKNENHHRRSISKFIGKFSDDDILIVSDGDELIKRSVMQEIRDSLNDNTIYGMLPIEIEQTMYSCTLKNPIGDWMGPKIATVGYCKTQDLHNFRTVACTSVLNGGKPLGGGWHLSNFGGAEQVKQKIESWAHQDYNNPEILENLEWRIRENRDIFGRDNGLAPVNGGVGATEKKDDTEIEWDNMPQMVIDNKEDYK
tara:strand:- start:794 stop:1642 length:849 start_codon:yes stop_codon:yes gene_type:complete